VTYPTPRRRVVLLGATGSIGRQACDVIAQFPDRFELVGAVAGTDGAALEGIASRFGVARTALVHGDPNGRLPAGCAVGIDAACEIAAMDADVVCVAITGAAALRPTLAAIDAGATVATATKEVLVMAGELVKARAAAAGARIIPIDSEHSALWQCLRGEDPASVLRLVLTASGGPFLRRPLDTFASITPAEALAHPTWNMGPKVTIDSATMMNKGLEVIEAAYLFGLTAEEIDVLVHPQSIIHGMVEFSDRSVVAQLGAPDMRTPIAHCLGWPDRITGPAAKLDLAKIGQLTFEAPDFERFPGLRLAYEALRTGRGATTVYNAANEVAVAAFIAGKIRFGAIARLVESTLEAWIRSGNLAPLTSADDAIAVDYNARNKAVTLLPQIALKAS
jgi:1-deoxy-D-xylulose-5-phosphate reductoisomerase